MNILNNCTLCPRNCRVNRIEGKLGKCRAGIKPKIALADLHFFEEPCISGKEGSGTVFFTGCNLSCKFCQNYKISQGDIGKEYSIEELADIMLKQQEKGVNNINLVTPTIYAYQIVEAIKIAKSKGLSIPIVYNSSGYEKRETIAMMKDGVYIINTSRGKLIDTDSLIERLEQGKIGGLGLDVYEDEEEFFMNDMSNSYIRDKDLSILLSMPNVVITSHQAFFTSEALNKIASDTCENIKDIFEKGSSENEVKK